jgi:hypothetical protein
VRKPDDIPAFNRAIIALIANARTRVVTARIE